MVLGLGLAHQAYSQPVRRILSLDQCADQYVLAISARSEIVGLSKRSLNTDSRFATSAVGIPQNRVSPEALLGARPTVAIRYWGGSARDIAHLTAQGTRVVTIDDAVDFTGVRRDIRKVAAALGRPEAGEALVLGMDQKLRIAAGAWRGQGGYYLTSGGVSAGPATLIDAILKAAGVTNLERRANFPSVSLERLMRAPIPLFVLGYFGPAADAGQRWSSGRRDVLQRRLARSKVVRLPSDTLGCPAWFAADAVTAIARAAPRRSVPRP